MTEPKDTDANKGVPAAWRTKGPAVKTWSAGKRTDDPTKREVLAPTQPGLGDGKAVFFFFGFRVHSPQDKVFVTGELGELQDDFAALRAAGFTVVVDTEATQKDFLDAVAGQGEGVKGLAPVCVYWSAHGDEKGAMYASDGGTLAPDDVDPATVLPSLRLVVFAACYVGSRARSWRARLGNHPLVVGWGNPVTITRAVEFLQSRADTETDLDDLLRRFVLRDEPLPGAPASNDECAPPAVSLGRSSGLAERMSGVAAMLGTTAAQGAKCVTVEVPLETHRRQVVSVFLLDSTQPYSEGEVLVGMEATVGDLSSVVEVSALLRDQGVPGYARVALVQSDTESPRIVAQGFLPSRAADRDLVAMLYQVAHTADVLEQRIFGTDGS